MWSLLCSGREDQSCQVTPQMTAGKKVKRARPRPAPPLRVTWGLQLKPMNDSLPRCGRNRLDRQALPFRSFRPGSCLEAPSSCPFLPSERLTGAPPPRTPTNTTPHRTWMVCYPPLASCEVDRVSSGSSDIGWSSSPLPRARASTCNKTKPHKSTRSKGYPIESKVFDGDDT